MLRRLTESPRESFPKANRSFPVDFKSVSSEGAFRARDPTPRPLRWSVTGRVNLRLEALAFFLFVSEDLVPSFF